jgi:hypothetical protein
MNPRLERRKAPQTARGFNYTDPAAVHGGDVRGLDARVHRLGRLRHRRLRPPPDKDTDPGVMLAAAMVFDN